MQIQHLHWESRYVAVYGAAGGVALVLALAAISPGLWPYLLFPFLLFGGLLALGVYDLAQTRHAILRNYPILAHMRFFFEKIRPEMRQYFFEADHDGAPFTRDKRAIVYQRAKKALDKRPFGTQRDVYLTHYEWMHHSVAPMPSVH